MQQVIEKSSYNNRSQSEILIAQALEYHYSGDSANAHKSVNLAMELEPSNDACFYTLGVFYLDKKQWQKAADSFINAISLNNQNLMYFYQLGIVYKNQGKIHEGLRMQQRALQLSGTNIPCLNEVALLHMKIGELSEAESSLTQAYGLDSTDVTTCINLSSLYLLKTQLRESIEFSNRAIQLDPNRPEAYCNMGTALIAANYHKQGIDYLRQAMSFNTTKSNLTHESMLMIMLYEDCFTPENIFLEHKKWASTYLPNNSSKHNNVNRVANQKIKVGFVSPDFKDHSISYFFIPLLKSLNSTEFHTTCYSMVSKPDHITKQIENLSGKWHNIKEMDDKSVVTLIEKDNIDILIDLSGHSLGSRIEIFNPKPAPVQMSYLGYPFSTGLNSIDYRITDSFSDPLNTTEHLHSEDLIRLDPSFLCYNPPDEIPIGDKLPVEKNSYITFGSLNNFSKLSKSTILTWANILNDVKDSRLVLKNINPVPDLLRDNILTTFLNFGIDASRVTLYHAIDKREEHLTLYNEIDICLDPFPYNGTTTTFEAIFMGTPVITLAGKSHHSRVGHSILSNLELDKLSANSKEKYIEIVSQLANDIPRLRHYRKTLRQTLLNSPLTDSTLFTKKFEKVLKQCWSNFICQQENHMEKHV